MKAFASNHAGDTDIPPQVLDAGEVVGEIRADWAFRRARCLETAGPPIAAGLGECSVDAGNAGESCEREFA